MITAQEFVTLQAVLAATILVGYIVIKKARQAWIG